MNYENMTRRRVLCFGDSNTYGYDPARDGRYGEDERYPMVLQDLLGDGWSGLPAESRWAVKQAVIQGLSAVLRRLNIDLQHLLQLTLADIVIERLRTNLRLQLPILYRLICIDYSTFQNSYLIKNSIKLGYSYILLKCIKKRR